MSADTAGRWAPDEQLIAAVRCGSGAHKMAELADPDRAWVVAGLTLAGLTADDIKDRLGCSLRLVRSIRAWPMTQVCLLLQTESQHFAQQMALSESDARALRRELTVLTDERDRYKGQLDRVIDARLVGKPVDVCGQGHLMVDHNVYWHGGRRWCRECHATRQRDYRLARKLGVAARAVRAAREAGDLDGFVTRVVSSRAHGNDVLHPASTIGSPHALWASSRS